MLAAANLTLVALLVVHTLDHVLRQTAPVPAEAAFAGIAGIGVTLAALGLSLAQSRLAPLATAGVGFATAVGFVAIHVVPEWSLFSQPYADIDVDALSWTGMLVPAVAAAGIGALGLSRLRTRA
jgi:hypothetical protein